MSSRCLCVYKLLPSYYYPIVIFLAFLLQGDLESDDLSLAVIRKVF